MLPKISIFRKIEGEFILYTNIELIEKHGNITLKPFSNITFKEDLIQCSGLITNAGFQLPSEALFLGKPMLCKPLNGQPEQEHNAKIEGFNFESINNLETLILEKLEQKRNKVNTKGATLASEIIRKMIK